MDWRWTKKNELYHHGILGQKWGKKNGPPYPLDSSDHSSSEKKAGWRKSLSKAASAVKKVASATNKTSDSDGYTSKAKKSGADSDGYTSKAKKLPGTVKSSFGSKYKNADGTLNEKGQQRLQQDIQDNNGKKKDNRIIIDEEHPENNTRRWEREDKERTLETVNESKKLVDELSKVEQNTRTQSTKKRMDLSSMSDKELRDQINRELLEQQYNKLFAEETTPQTSSGRTFVQNTLEAAGTVLALTGSALSIALSIQKLTGKG